MSTSFEPAALSDADYRRLSGAVLSSVEAEADRLLQDDVVDIDSSRTGGLLELSFPNGSKIVINTQPPLQELWLASRAGGFHYRYSPGDHASQGRWLDTRNGSEFFAALSREASAQAGCSVRFTPP